jgi:hypothetical protein
MDKIDLSRCSGVSYGFSGRSLLDKFVQVFSANRRLADLAWASSRKVLRIRLSIFEPQGPIRSRGI